MNYTLIEFAEIESTNTLLKTYFDAFPHMTIIRTDYQTGGRGRYQRKWMSNKNENILFSILLKDIKTKYIEKINRWAIDALMEFLYKQNVKPIFKEPNDIYVEDKKIAGLLIETKANQDCFEYVVIGIGLNVNQTSFEDLVATSMKLETSQTYHIKSLFQALFKDLIESYPLQ
jgi:BirA family transcriptional regulator, biotin operon repressor / biotin---[acetyl-CoA-carboxylase] ligase